MRTSTLVLACLMVLVAAPVGSARAATKTIPMDAFKLGCPPPSYFMQNPAVVSVPASASGNWYGVAPLRLPVGSVIQGVTYFRWADPGSSTSVTLDRTRPPQGPETLAGLFDYATTPDHQYYPLELMLSPVGDLVVRSGYRYYVSVSISKGAGVSGVKVRYKPPAH